MKRIITTYKKLKDQDGEAVCIQGLFRVRREIEPYSTNRIILEDDMEVILPPRVPEELPDFFKCEYDEKLMLICGNVFIKEIPKKYNVKSRKLVPYLFDLNYIQLNDE